MRLKTGAIGLRYKLLLTAFAFLAAAGLLRLATFATFTATTDISQTTLTSGSISLTSPAPGPGNRLTLGATSIVPGDTMQRAINITNGGAAGMSAIVLSTAASPSSLLDTDTTNGLQMSIDKCSVAWTETGSSPAYSYSCSGTTSSVLASRPVIGSNIALANMGAINAATTDYLRFNLTFPSGAGNSLQGQSSAITYSFSGIQTTGTNR